MSLVTRLETDGFAFVEGADMRELLGGAPADWDAFAASWNELHLDKYMADGGRYRRRRHALFSAGSGAITRKPHGPHFQTLDYNHLHGGIERWFEPIASDTQSLATILAWSRKTFEALSPVRAWDIEAHQFRIEASADAAGQPTPEGVHRDGVDYVLVLLVRRTNIASGTTTIHAPDGTMLGSFTLAHPFDAALVDDARLSHGVTPVEPIDPQQAAYRDVLVVTFRAAAPQRTSA
ncbi:MAG: 2OG-Fe dioxygenase family protein [Myxococcota bacterium]|nr:2OG-Fe dioxygenase family protein [Deltaproteobacteria bacterium]MDQ3339639.1 2OG-Fe dioxygenase family protein [Myxococcota bacterium]